LWLSTGSSTEYLLRNPLTKTFHGVPAERSPGKDVPRSTCREVPWQRCSTEYLPRYPLAETFHGVPAERSLAKTFHGVPAEIRGKYIPQSTCREIPWQGRSSEYLPRDPLGRTFHGVPAERSPGTTCPCVESQSFITIKDAGFLGRSSAL
jgi:hypothetical protein